MEKTKTYKLSGRIACRGKVQGRSRVIKKYADLISVLEGEILITSQTDMNYVPWLQKCIGLVTESGGRNCHAAIFARENKLPCITDVKGARNIISTGDEIELDADNNLIHLVL